MHLKTPVIYLPCTLRTVCVQLSLALIGISSSIASASEGSAPQILDVPVLSITGQDVEFSVLYRLSAQQSNERAVEQTSARFATVQEGTKVDITSKQWAKSSLTQSLALNAKLPGNGVFPINMNFSSGTSAESGQQLDLAEIQNYDRRLSISESVTEARKLTQRTDLAWGAFDGQISTGFIITNTGTVGVKLQKIRAVIEFVSPQNGAVVRGLAAVPLYEGVEEYASAPVTEAGKTAPSNNLSTPPEPLKLELDPGQRYTQRLVFARRNTNEVITFMNESAKPRVRLEYDAYVADKKVNPQRAAVAALQRSIGARIIGTDSDEQQYFVDASVDGLTVEAVMRAIDPLMRWAGDAGNRHMEKFENQVADCAPSELDDVTKARQAPGDGAWILGVVQERGASPLTDSTLRVPRGTQFVAAFVTRGEVREGMRQVSHKSQAAGVNGQPEPPIPVGMVKLGDIVTMRIRGKKSGDREFEAQPVEIPNTTYSRALFNWASAKEVGPEASWKLLPDPKTPGSYGVDVDFGNGAVSLDSLVPNRSGWFDIRPDHTVQLRFVVTPALLTQSVVSMALRFPYQTNKLMLGRKANPPPPPSGRNASVPGQFNPYGEIERWVQANPLRQVEVPELRQFDYDVMIESLPELTYRDVRDQSALGPAEIVSKRWVEYMKAGRYSDAWDLMAPEFQATFSGGLDAYVREVKDSWRLMQHDRAEVKIGTGRDLTGLPPGEVVVINYEGKIEDGRVVAEQVGLLNRDGKWLLEHYTAMFRSSPSLGTAIR